MLAEYCGETYILQESGVIYIYSVFGIALFYKYIA